MATCDPGRVGQEIGPHQFWLAAEARWTSSRSSTASAARRYGLRSAKRRTAAAVAALEADADEQ
ncbi:hypothetical protein [Propionicimonas sp.]|uniref:hypothetical protein n=1 Tax=Propionicimonas sp. TaxID=1955623 RepID=UPI0017FF57BC|nr:hypothetical protein [Propionicimonas sp.]MBA3019651.1 hypothetical protein [Propionicimonas sp.]MBU4208004.1 hypothetical protein [Actinomycetota bacterium]MBU4411458.1 hypothetical protein [Actinomycetota bacterium]MCG2805770.1 hypothetical protein [Propionicimonas sp.]